MALRDQPYLPLYIQDIMTDEKLNECSPATHGIYIKGIMCLMHKSEDYGKLLLKQKYKQTESISLNFGYQLTKHLPYSPEQIQNAIDELIRERVCFYDGDFLCQKRMIHDNLVSEARSSAAKKGGGNPNFVKTKSLTKPKTKPQTNSEYENEYENEIKSSSFSSDFNKVWNELILMPKWKKKPKSAIKKSLSQLEKFDEPFAIGLIEKAIAGNYQGVVFSNTEAEYKKSKQPNETHRRTNGFHCPETSATITGITRDLAEVDKERFGT